MNRCQRPFNYQNVNTALLGVVLSHLYGDRSPELLAEKIWQPALAETAAWLQPLTRGRGRRLLLHLRDGA